MTSSDKVFDSVVRGQSDANLRFADLCKLAKALGFAERIKGDHHIYSRKDVVEILNFQPLANGKAKPYQVKQLRRIITNYKLALNP